ncbi:hypothetical protein IP91_01174 [Pseudoduganella lurida]|uniref:Uncharacterized protein n=1 Tax=Pseudoduganella lurida TaxID=1036180 RepID=A0A562RND8_9BURK|nr:hypothetical protein [Pseudoduganella lurida]TWI70094.1 hypothetical protein IP91_01174 [Pseudoduganella lurida]
MTSPAARLASLAACLIIPCTFGSPAAAQTTVPFEFPDVASGTCTFAAANLPKDTIVVAAGSYRGRELPFAIDQSGHQATTISVAVHADQPVALLLGAYEPTVWAIGWSKGTRVVAVFASGYHRQAVAGLPKGTPVITSSYQEKGPCGHRYISGGGHAEWVNPAAREIFGAPAIRLYDKATNGAIEIVESTRPRTGYVTSADTPVESFHDRKAPLAGTPGLQEAVRRGILRPLTAADIEQVREHYRRLAAADPKRDVPPLANGSMPVAIPELSLRRGFVVLKPFEFPAGLYGAHLAYFLVPPGVPAPTGTPGHSMIVDLNKPVPCSGPMCRQ